MSPGLGERLKGQNPLLVLTLVLTALFAWASGGLASGGLVSASLVSAGLVSPGTAANGEAPQQSVSAQADRLLPAGFAHIAPVDAPDQDDLETLSEQLEDPLPALGQHVIAFEAASEAEQTAHGAVRGWAVLASSFRSSSARGPPLS